MVRLPVLKGKLLPTFSGGSSKMFISRQFTCAVCCCSLLLLLVDVADFVGEGMHGDFWLDVRRSPQLLID